MHRLGYSLIAAHGEVVLTWSEAIQHIRMPYATAYAMARHLTDVGLHAETQAGLTMDRSAPPERVETQFRPEGGDVLLDMGVFQQTFAWPPAIAFSMANALVQTGELAQRWLTKGPGMTPKEVDRMEEAILGDPIVIPGNDGPSLVKVPGVPLVGERYFYRPESEMVRVVRVDLADHRADVLLPTGQMFQGVSWNDLLDPARVIRRAPAIPSRETFGRASLS